MCQFNSRLRHHHIAVRSLSAGGVSLCPFYPFPLRKSNPLRAEPRSPPLHKLLGHSDLTMTRRYCELSQADVAQKHRLYSPGDKVATRNTSGRKRLRSAIGGYTQPCVYFE
ncbi:MAG: hypothetical protein NTU88_10950 [Armatimonadetes bacterium]|nr:hypothetical protein [Armatimonadota bacterium]